MSPTRFFPASSAVLLLLAGLLTGAGALHAARPSVAASEATSVVAVEVPVTVLDDGKPVRGLTADDFIVEDGRARQTLTGFEMIDLKAPATRTVPVARVQAAGRRHFLLLFDLTFSEPTSVVKARDAAKALLASGFDPTDLIAVGTYTAAEGPRLVLGFTSDPRQVAHAVDTLGFSQLGDRNPDPLGLLLGDAGLGQTPAPNGGVDAARAGMQASVLDVLKSMAQRDAQANRTLQKNQVAAFTRAVADLAKALGSIEGRKHVVYLSEGFDSSLLLGTTDQKAIDDANEAAASGEVWKIDSEERFGNTKSTSDLTRMLEEFRRADCTIQAVDIGGLRAGEGGVRPKGEDSLYMMANGTGGELYRNFNDLSQALSSLLERTSVTYLLTFQPADLTLDGKYHKLRVRLKDERGGRRVLFRPGYYAPRPFEQQSGLEKQLAGASLILGGEEGGSLPTSVLAAPYRMPGQKAYVPLLLEVDGPALLAGATAGQSVLKTELFAYAIDEHGGISDHFAQTLGLDLGKVAPVLKGAGLRFYGHLDLDPGQYVVRVLVRDGRGAHGVATTALTVPAFDGASPVLLPPLFPDLDNRWLILREGGGREALRPVPYPFMRQDQPFVPAARPVLAAGAEAHLTLIGWGLGSGALEAQAQVFAPDGSQKEGSRLTLDGRVPDGVTGFAGSDQLLARFQPGALAPGAYTLVVTVRDPASGRQGSSTVPFLVAAAGASAGR